MAPSEQMTPLLCLIIGVAVGLSSADTPANCSYEQIQGRWTLFETERTFTKDLSCEGAGPVVHQTQVTLYFPNVAVDAVGNEGTWTLIYNQGFEVTVNYRKYFAFSDYKAQGTNVTSYCDRTQPGWSHDVLGHNWACFTARKVDSLPATVHMRKTALEIAQNGPEVNDHLLISRINSHQTSWKARHYPQFESKTREELQLLAGGPKSTLISHPPPAPIDEELKSLVAELPTSFDWRNVDGQNFVSPVRNQGSCGSCYSFSTMGMIESRLRVQTNNTVKVQLSPQEIVSCSKYSQGCSGGFPYLISKFGQDYGYVPEQCYTYEGKDDSCKKTKCARTFVASYNYVGGFYGGCNEDLMKLVLVKNGPLSVSFEVYSDFMNYAGGVYYHTGLKSGFNPFAITNHAVLLVGYGTEGKEKYWIVKNSWGTNWGEQGYFRIRRGTNECNIESIAVEAFPIP